MHITNRSDATSFDFFAVVPSRSRFHFATVIYREDSMSRHSRATTDAAELSNCLNLPVSSSKSKQRNVVTFAKAISRTTGATHNT